MDIEENKKLPFLDVLVTKKSDNILDHQMYRKLTHTARYLHAELHHHPAQKQSAINSLVHKVFTISDKEHLQMEFNHLKQALQKNGHDKKDINKIISKHTSKAMNPTHNHHKMRRAKERASSILLNIKGTMNTTFKPFSNLPKR